jgi:hypothetical protein
MIQIERGPSDSSYVRRRRGESKLGTIISFPTLERRRRSSSNNSGSATVIILPVIRIERHLDQPTGGFEPEMNASPRRRRRRRAAR